MEVNQVIEWMQAFNKRVQEEKDYLSELDTPIGDGDHGGNMARGMKAVIDALEEKEFNTTTEVFKVIAMQLIGKVGGASGPLYGSAFMGMGQSSDASLAEMIESGLLMIQKRGKAEVGQKTMVDVWARVVESLKSDNLTSQKIDEFVESTKDMKATKGRASYLGERSVGHIDPGAYSSGLLFKALMEVE